MTLKNEYEVTFIGDYFRMVVSVEDIEGSVDGAIDVARDMILTTHGWDMRKKSTGGIEVVCLTSDLFRDYWCAECGEPIVGTDIDDRHSTEEGEDVHSKCCEECKK